MLREREREKYNYDIKMIWQICLCVWVIAIYPTIIEIQSDKLKKKNSVIILNRNILHDLHEKNEL